LEVPGGIQLDHRGLVLNRNLIGPFACEGSTTRPFCVIWIIPAATSLRAACLAGSISGRQSSERERAASEGHIDLDPPRSVSRSMMAASNARSMSDKRRRLRHALEQYRTDSQSAAHFLRQVIVRPQTAQTLVSMRCMVIGVSA
jgi:hypothetical protein